MLNLVYTATERDLDALIDSHERHINTFVRSVSQAYAPAARTLQVLDPLIVPYDRSLVNKKRNRQRQTDLLKCVTFPISFSLRLVRLAINPRNDSYQII